MQDHGRWQRGTGEGESRPHWIFMHGTDIVERGLIMLFLVFFVIFRFFIPLTPPENFSANVFVQDDNNVLHSMSYDDLKVRALELLSGVEQRNSAKKRLFKGRQGLGESREVSLRL